MWTGHVLHIIGVIVESILWKMGYLTSDWLLTTFLSRKKNYFLHRNSTGKCLDFVNFFPQDKLNEEKILIDSSSLVFKELANHGKKSKTRYFFRGFLHFVETILWIHYQYVGDWGSHGRPKITQLSMYINYLT